jgi:hypothetical protein
MFNGSSRQGLAEEDYSRCNKDDDYGLLLMYMSRIVKKRVWKAYSLRRSRQESLEEEEPSRKVSRRRNNETDTTSVGAHGKKREDGQKAYTFGAHGGTKKLLLAVRSWRTNKAPSQPALQ